MKEEIDVLVWTEGIFAEREPEAAKIYPDGIGKVLTEFLSKDSRLNVREGNLDTMSRDFAEESLEQIDVLVWWDHLYQDEITDEALERILRRIREGMGFIALHSAIGSRILRALLGTTCTFKWREAGEKERVWIIERGHPIVSGLENEYIDIPHSEMYGESADIPAPDELIFISWYAGGEVLRSGGCYKRGMGRIFYLSPGHEEYPIYYQAEIRKIITNAVHWACPTGGPAARYSSHSAPLENIAIIN